MFTWEKFWAEAYRIARAGAQAGAGFFGATSIGVGGAKPITGSVVWDAVVAAVLTAFAVGASRQSDGKTVIPGVTIMPPRTGGGGGGGGA